MEKNMSRILRALLAAALLATGFGTAQAQAPHRHAPQAAHAMPDKREEVAFPAQLKEHTLANMRDHLLTLQRIQEALAKGAFDSAAQLAESRLGMSSLQLHGAHEVARFMPQGMQEIGTAMHKSASRFAIEAGNASATGDVRGPLSALAAVTAHCVACHAAYRLK
jgi:hypothetical protein